MSATQSLLVFSYYYPPSNSSGVFRTLYFMNYIARRCKWTPYIISCLIDDFHDCNEKDSELSRQISPNIRVHYRKDLQVRNRFIALQQHNRIALRDRHVNACSVAADRDDITQLKFWQSIKDIVTEELLAFPDRQVGWIPFALKRSFELHRKHCFDAVYSSGSPWSSHFCGYIFSRIAQVPLVLDYRDPWFSNPYAEKRSNLYLIASYNLEKKIIREASCIVCNTERMLNTYCAKFGQREKFIVIPNGYERLPFLCNGTFSKNDSREWIFVHSGSLYGARNPDNFIRAIVDFIHLYPDIPIRVYFIGTDENMERRIEALVGSDLKQRYFVVTPRLPHRECLSHLMKASVLLLFQQGTDMQVPRKLYEYISMQRPILAICDEGETRDIMNENRLGITVHDDEADILDALKRLYWPDRDIEHGNSDVSKFDNELLSQRLEDCLDRVIRLRT